MLKYMIHEKLFSSRCDSNQNQNSVNAVRKCRPLPLCNPARAISSVQGGSTQTGVVLSRTRHGAWVMRASSLPLMTMATKSTYLYLSRLRHASCVKAKNPLTHDKKKNAPVRVERGKPKDVRSPDQTPSVCIHHIVLGAPNQIDAVGEAQARCRGVANTSPPSISFLRQANGTMRTVRATRYSKKSGTRTKKWGAACGWVFSTEKRIRIRNNHRTLPSPTTREKIADFVRGQQRRRLLRKKN
ncbi:unnamed protein product [Ectocarpus fasciculatus]